MIKKLLALLFFLGSFLMHSQNSVWRTNTNDAIKMSNEQRKPLLIFFTANGISKSIQNEVFATSDFLDWSDKNVVLLKLDLSDVSLSDDEKQQNIRLKEALGVEGLPQVCLAKAFIRKNIPRIDKLGMLDYKAGGAKQCISDATLILRGE